MVDRELKRALQGPKRTLEGPKWALEDPVGQIGPKILRGDPPPHVVQAEVVRAPGLLAI